MRVFIAVLVLILSLQSWTKADDISDFEIEGMSIGDSALKYFSENELKNSLDIGTYKSKEFTYYFLEKNNSLTYEYIQIHTKYEDKNYIINGVEGHILYETDIQSCYLKMKEVKAEIDNIFDLRALKDKGKHPTDPTGKSTYSRIMYTFSNGDYVEIICYDMSKEFEKEGTVDRFVVSLGTKELMDFLTYRAY